MKSLFKYLNYYMRALEEWRVIHYNSKAREGVWIEDSGGHLLSGLGAMADRRLVVEVPGREAIAREKKCQARQLLGEHESLALMGTLFEDTSRVT